MLLDTHLRYGEISYDEEDVQSWDQSWRPSEKTVQHLRRDWKSTPVAKVSFISNGFGSVSCSVKEVKEGWCPWLRGHLSFCLLWCFEKSKAHLSSCLLWCFEKIKACVIACLCLLWAMLIWCYERLLEKWQARR